MISVGIENFVAEPPAALKGAKLALLCNQASTNRRFHHSRDLIEGVFPGGLTCLFSPQHGFFSEKQDNMVESDHMRDPFSGLPIFSLYAEKRRPDPEMFELFDVLIVDLSDVGTRVYTFLYTLAYCLEAAAAAGKKVIVLDRPNPLGGLITEGNILRPSCFSFVGLYPLPMRHGLTIGELALLLKNHFGIDVDLEVVPLVGWKRRMLFADTGFPWVFPSPNMVTPVTALVYPGQVIWEGTNISEGRGTTMPFELFGAPFLHCRQLREAVDMTNLPGCALRPLVFEPTAGKWAGRLCNGFQLHVEEPLHFMPYRTTLTLLQAVLSLYPDDFAYKSPPYEYEYERLPLDLIIGDGDLRRRLAAGEPIMELERSWQQGLEEFTEMRRSVFLYD